MNLGIHAENVLLLLAWTDIDKNNILLVRLVENMPDNKNKKFTQLTKYKLSWLHLNNKIVIATAAIHVINSGCN